MSLWTGQYQHSALNTTRKQYFVIKNKPPFSRHEIAEIAGVVSISCYNGQDKEKHVVLFKKESCPSEEELKKRRLGEVSFVHLRSEI